VRYDYSVLISRPPETAYAFLAGIQRHSCPPGSPVDAMIKTPCDPTRVGIRWREAVALIRLATMTVHSEVTAAEPGRRLAMTSNARGDSTRPTMSFAGTQRRSERPRTVCGWLVRDGTGRWRGA
jgi:hypothetical protein